MCEEVDKLKTDEEKGSKTVQLTSGPTNARIQDEVTFQLFASHEWLDTKIHEDALGRVRFVNIHTYILTYFGNVSAHRRERSASLDSLC